MGWWLGYMVFSNLNDSMIFKSYLHYIHLEGENPQNLPKCNSEVDS